MGRSSMSRPRCPVEFAGLPCPWPLTGRQDGDGAAEGGAPTEAKEIVVSREAAYHQIQLPIKELDLSVRALNCLEGENIQTIGDLVRRTPDDLMKLRNFGRTTLKEIEKKLEERGLKLGLDVDAIMER